MFEGLAGNLMCRKAGSDSPLGEALMGGGEFSSPRRGGLPDAQVLKGWSLSVICTDAEDLYEVQLGSAGVVNNCSESLAQFSEFLHITMNNTNM